MIEDLKIIYAAASLRTSAQKTGLQGDSHEQQREQILRRAEQVSIILGVKIVIVKWFKFTESAGGEYDTQPILESVEYCKDPKIKYFFVRSIDRGTRGGGGIYDQLKAGFARYGTQLLDSYGIIGTSVINTLDYFGVKYDWSEFSPTQTNELIVAEGAKEERRNILTRLIGSEIRYTRLGYPMNASPIGLMNVKVDTQHGERKIRKADPEESPWILRGYELRIQGNVSDNEIINELNLMGYKSRRTKKYDPKDKTRVIGYGGQKKLTVKHFQVLIQNPEYAGIYVHAWTNNKPIKGQIEPLVTIEMFNKANRGKVVIILQDGEIMIVKSNKPEWQAVKKKDNPLFPYKKEVLCPQCRNPLLGSASTGNHGTPRPAYHCGRLINGKRCTYRIKLREFNDTIEGFVKDVQFSDEFRERFREIALEELVNRENQLSSDTISYSRQIEAKQIEIQNLKDKIKLLSSPETIKMFEDDIEKLRIERALLINQRDNKEDQQVDSQVAINYTNYFIEHLEDLLLGGSNPQKNASLFGLLFDEKPTYEDLVHRTPKLACLFKLNEDFKTTKSLDVSRVGLEPTTDGLRVHCSTIELSARKNCNAILNISYYTQSERQIRVSRVPGDCLQLFGLRLLNLTLADVLRHQLYKDPYRGHFLKCRHQTPNPPHPHLKILPRLLKPSLQTHAFCHH